MSQMRAFFRSRVEWPGGVLGYPLNALYEEIAFIAYHFHWPPEAVMNLEHLDRRRWVQEISAIHRRLNENHA